MELVLHFIGWSIILGFALAGIVIWIACHLVAYEDYTDGRLGNLAFFVISDIVALLTFAIFAVTY